jgi:exodeoxyribonuclease VIII
MIPIEPGWYPGTLMSEYLAWDIASHSRLKDLDVSPARCRWNIDHPREEASDTLTLGSAIHCAILEPGLFADYYVRLPGDDRRLKDVKDAIAAAADSGLIALRPSDWEKCQRIREAIWRNRAAREILEAAENCERPGVARVGDGLFKFRPDIISESLGVHADIKSTQDARPEAFGRSILAYQYHRSGALYREAMRCLGVDVPRYVCIALTKSEPYEVAVYEIAERALEVGLDDGLRLLKLYHECEQTDVWAGLPETAQPIDLPPWGYTRSETDAPLTIDGIPMEV